MKQPQKYLGQFILSMVSYMILLTASVIYLKSAPDSALDIPIALAPVIPAIFILIVIVRAVSSMDELQRKIQLEAVVLGFCATGILTFSYGFLENAGFPHLSWVWMLPLMVVLWGIGQAIAVRRYR